MFSRKPPGTISTFRPYTSLSKCTLNRLGNPWSSAKSSLVNVGTTTKVAKCSVTDSHADTFPQMPFWCLDGVRTTCWVFQWSHVLWQVRGCRPLQEEWYPPKIQPIKQTSTAPKMSLHNTAEMLHWEGTMKTGPKWAVNKSHDLLYTELFIPALFFQTAVSRERNELD